MATEISDFNSFTLPQLHAQVHRLRKTNHKMPSKLSKVHKQITKKKGPTNIKALHENSRDARRLRRAGARDDRVHRITHVREKANRVWLERVAFFQDSLPDTLNPLAVDEIKVLIDDFLNRHDEEIEQLRAERRTGRPASTRQTLLEQQRAMEGKEYESGFWMPNLGDDQTVVKLDGWKGGWVDLGVMRFVRVHRGGEVKESSFPPRGAS